MSSLRDILTTRDSWACVTPGHFPMYLRRFTMASDGYDFELWSTPFGSWSVTVRRGGEFLRYLSVLSDELCEGKFEKGDGGSMEPTVGTVTALGVLLVRGYLAGLKESGRGARGKQTKLRRALARLLP